MKTTSATALLTVGSNQYEALTLFHDIRCSSRSTVYPLLACFAHGKHLHLLLSFKSGRSTNFVPPHIYTVISIHHFLTRVILLLPFFFSRSSLACEASGRCTASSISPFGLSPHLTCLNSRRDTMYPRFSGKASFRPPLKPTLIPTAMYGRRHQCVP